jgi:hypothetical protein
MATRRCVIVLAVGLLTALVTVVPAPARHRVGNVADAALFTSIVSQRRPGSGR